MNQGGFKPFQKFDARAAQNTQLYEDFMQTIIIIGLVYAGLFVTTKVSSKNLLSNWTKCERFSSYYFLIYGVIIHVLLNPLSGFLGKYRPLAIFYRVMDTRYMTMDTNHDESANISTLTCIIEMVFLAPACVILSRKFRTERSIQREKWVLIVLGLQFLTRFAYLYEELIQNNMSHLCRQGNCFSFTFHNLIYVWLSTFIFYGVQTFLSLKVLQISLKNFSNHSQSEQEKSQKQESKSQKKRK